MSCMLPCPTGLLLLQAREDHRAVEGTADPALAAITGPAEIASHPAAGAGKGLLINAMPYRETAPDAIPHPAIKGMTNLHDQHPPLSAIERAGKGSASNSWG